MAEYETQYQQLSVYDDDDDDDDGNDTDNHTDADLMIHVVPEGGKARWNHIENLDEFFTRVYQYHQRQGFLCMVLEDVLQLGQFVFVIVFSTFLLKCVDYDVLFDNVRHTTTGIVNNKTNTVILNDTSHKVSLHDAIIPSGQCLQSFGFWIVLCLIVASAFWMFRVVKVVYNIFRYYEIRLFYGTALKITATDLPNMTWHEVQAKLLEVQREQQMCIHKKDLTQLDIYHRIVRFKNYTVAMVNKSVLPLKLTLPLLGEYVFLSTGLKYNMEFLLYWGPWSAFENKWRLRDEYKDKSYHRRKQLSEKLSKQILWLGLANLIFFPIIFLWLSKQILWLGLANLVFFPIIFLWQILYSFFRYAELVKRQPAFLGSRRWSNYGRLYLRHFNELDHEFDARLNRGYKAADAYLKIFMSPLLAIIAKNIAFFAGSILAVLVVLTVYDEDVINVEHILTIMTVAGVVVTSCKVLIPDEHAVYCPEVLMRNILSQIHYMPDHWMGNAHTSKVRDEFGLLFQYKAVYLVEELLSPIVTPLMLIFKFRHKASDIVDFFHNFTVDVVGVGDVCSFAEMDIKKHGNPQWTSEEATNASMTEQGEDGKVEMSLMHFHLTNPEWKPPENCSLFLNDIKDQVQRDMSSMSAFHSQIGYHSMVPSAATGLGYTSMVSSITGQSTVLSPSVNISGAPFASAGAPKLRGAVSHCEGPLSGSGGSMIPGVGSPMTSGHGPITSLPGSSIQSHTSIHPPTSLLGQPTSTSQTQYDEGQIEMLSAEMSISALYMHDLRTRRSRGYGYETLDDIRARALWQRQETPQATPSSGGTPTMPNIEEETSEKIDGGQG